jgi:CheY-like chemotaxis protein
MRVTTQGGLTMATEERVTRPRVLLIASDATTAAIRTQWGVDLQRDYQLEARPLLADALADARAGAYGAILFDLKTPDGLGLEALSKLRAADPGAPIIVVGPDEDTDQTSSCFTTSRAVAWRAACAPRWSGRRSSANARSPWTVYASWSGSRPSSSTRPRTN